MILNAIAPSSGFGEQIKSVNSPTALFSGSPGRQKDVNSPGAKTDLPKGLPGLVLRYWKRFVTWLNDTQRRDKALAQEARFYGIHKAHLQAVRNTYA